MKRYLCILLILLLALCGCERNSPGARKEVVFYYLRSDISADETYGDADSVFVAEAQPSLDYSSKLSYLLALYLNGPSDGRLYSPFPAGLQIQSVQRFDETIEIICNDALARLKGLKLTKACACLALTCFGLTNAETVSVQTESELLDNQQAILISRSDLILEDIPLTGGNP